MHWHRHSSSLYPQSPPSLDTTHHVYSYMYILCHSHTTTHTYMYVFTCVCECVSNRILCTVYIMCYVCVGHAPDTRHARPLCHANTQPINQCQLKCSHIILRFFTVFCVKDILSGNVNYRHK